MKDKQHLINLLSEIEQYFSQIGKSRAIQAGMEKRLKEKIKEVKIVLSEK